MSASCQSSSLGDTGEGSVKQAQGILEHNLCAEHNLILSVSFFLKAIIHTRISRELFQGDIQKHFVQKLESSNSFQLINNGGSEVLELAAGDSGGLQNALSLPHAPQLQEATVGARLQVWARGGMDPEQVSQGKSGQLFHLPGTCSPLSLFPTPAFSLLCCQAF